MALDSLELQLASALQRFNTLQRRAQVKRDPTALLSKSLAELGTALEEVRVAQEQLVESRNRMEAIQEELRQQATKYWQLFDDMPQAYVLTDASTKINEVNRAGAELLNVSQRFLVGKVLSVFVCENRGPVLATCSRLADQGGSTELSLKVRPRERAPVDLAARITADGKGGLRWLLSAAPSASLTNTQTLPY